MDETSKIVSKATLSRLPAYYRYLKGKSALNIKDISSTTIAQDMNLSAIQVRKDLSIVSTIAGKPKTGFEVKRLILDIEDFLGYDNANEAILIGAGQLGKTLLSYSGFDNYGLNIVAAFDVNQSIIGRKINGKNIFSIDKLENFVKRTNINIGIITVPSQFAQGVCNLLIKSGVKAIWNFAPTHIIVPDDIVIKNEDMAASLAILSKQLTVVLKNSI